MKSLFIAGSRKFFDDIDKLVKRCKENGIVVSTAGKLLEHEDTSDSERNALFRAFERISKSDIVYIVANKGYIGKTVALEIAYAYAKGKEIISSEAIEDFSARALVSKVMTKEVLINYAK